LLVEKLFLFGFLEKLPSAVRYIYTLFLTVIGFTIFNANGIIGIAEYLSSMFGLNGIAFYNEESVYYLSSYALPLILGAVLSTPILKKIYSYISVNEAGAAVIEIIKPICYISILLICTASLIDGSFNPFIYFRF
jgi:alginate O-acetyltransferase complex protein AlgI